MRQNTLETINNWFFSKLITMNGCLLWNGQVNNKGYGQVKLVGRWIYVHRLSYFIFRGQIPNKLMVLHTCDNTRCVNPAHLFLGTQKDNMQDCKNKGRSNAGKKYITRRKKVVS
jgi:hypothetical protein